MSNSSTTGGKTQAQQGRPEYPPNGSTRQERIDWNKGYGQGSKK